MRRQTRSECPHSETIFSRFAGLAKAIELAELIYLVTSDFPKHELFGMTSQMRRAAVSIASNIAEGSARASKKDFRQFILIAKGSTCELQTQLVIASRLSYLSEASTLKCEHLADSVARMLSGLAKALKQPQAPTT